MPGNVCDWNGQQIDGTAMFELMNSLGERGVKSATQHLSDPQHRIFPRGLWIAEPAASPEVAKQTGRGAA
jgi:hypothetical protein